MGSQYYVLLVLVSMFIYGNTNTIDCLGDKACYDQTLNCNANEPCIINCDSQGAGSKACRHTNIYQNDATTMTVNCLNKWDCDWNHIYCGVGGCTMNCAREVDSCRTPSLKCDPSHCLSLNISEQLVASHCTNYCPPTLNPTAQPSSSKEPTTSNPTTSQPTTVSSTTYMPSTTVRTTDMSTTDMSTSSMRIPTVLTTTIPTSFMDTPHMPTATPIKHGTVNEIYTTDISNEYTLNKNELTTNDNKQSKILIYIILTIGSILCCCLCICIPKKYNKNKNIITENIQPSTPNLADVVGVNDVLMNGVGNEMNGVMIVTSGGPIENNQTNDGTFAKKSAPNNSDDDYEILSDDEIFNGVNTLHGENDYTVNEKVTHEGNSDGEQYMDPVLNSQT